jgi:predicted phage baseplate assembly protein
LREHLGMSDGSPGQRFQLKHTPVLERQPGEHLVVQAGEEPPLAWQESPNFAASGALDRHYTLDSASGELRLGPAIRQPDGTIKLYGAVPPRKAQLFFESYRYGGGQEGNVEAGILNTLKTAIPYIARVSNRDAARGGLDAESLEAAMVRLPAQLSSRDRAVTEADFEFLARDRLRGEVGRVKCIQPSQSTPGTAGRVFLLATPRVDQPDGPLTLDQLQLPAEDEADLKAYLDERRLLGTHLEIRPPAYSWVAVRVRLHAAANADRAKVEAEVLRRLYRFLNPLVGGQDGNGWTFGRSLYASEIHQCLAGVPGVEYLLGLNLYHAKPGGEATGDPVDFIELVAHGLVASGKHTVKFE